MRPALPARPAGPESQPKKARTAAPVAATAPAKGLTPRHQAALDDAKAGKMPTPPDFEADTHRPYRAKLEILVAMAKRGDVEGLKGVANNPTSTSPKALARYRDLAIVAIYAKRKATKA